VTTDLFGLSQNTKFFYRVVLTATDGEKVDGSWESFTTAAVHAPAVSLAADATDVRVGDTVKLTWTTSDSTTITASGDWSGTKDASGSQNVTIDRAGEFSFTLTATGEGGKTTATVDVKVALAATTLTVNVPSGLVHVGHTAKVAVTGLTGGEAYRITIAGITVGDGVASSDGSSSTAVVVVPAVLRDGTVPVEVLGSVDDRAGSASLRIVAAKKLTLKLKKSKVHNGGKQRVNVSGLAAFEPVRIVYKGKKIAALKASAKGTVAKAFKVGRAVGLKKIKVFGVTKDRSGVKAFKVTR
jgi:plastocyanin